MWRWAAGRLNSIEDSMQVTAASPRHGPSPNSPESLTLFTRYRSIPMQMREYEHSRRAKTGHPAGETKKHRQNRRRMKMNHSRRVGRIYAQDRSGIFPHVCGHVTEAPPVSLSSEALLSKSEIWLNLDKGRARVAAHCQDKLGFQSIQKLRGWCAKKCREKLSGFY